MAAKLTVHKTPTEQVLDEANKTYTTTDKNGRVIGFRKLKASDQRRIVKTLSNDSASKERYLGMVMLAACVISIDDDEVRFPTSELQFDALIDRLENEGFDALGAAVQKEFGVVVDEVEEAKNS